MGNNATKIVIEQTEDEALMSRLTLEHFGMDNGTANTVNTAATAQLVDLFSALAAAKAAQTGETFIPPKDVVKTTGFLWGD